MKGGVKAETPTGHMLHVSTEQNVKKCEKRIVNPLLTDACVLSTCYHAGNRNEDCL